MMPHAIVRHRPAPQASTVRTPAAKARGNHAGVFSIMHLGLREMTLADARPCCPRGSLRERKDRRDWKEMREGGRMGAAMACKPRRWSSPTQIVRLCGVGVAHTPESDAPTHGKGLCQSAVCDRIAAGCGCFA
eukprot:1004176-Rhodomonas_salina.1